MPPNALWIACLPAYGSSTPEPAGPWLARYGPQPVLHEDGWLLELSASQRLFGGRAALLRRLRHEGAALGWGRLGAAPTALAALAVARATPAAGGFGHALGPDWSARLDALPASHLGPARPHRPVLDALGLRTLGDLRRCPRAGLARRTAPGLLQALDALYGQAPLALPGWQAPERFHQTLALPAPSAETAALAFAGQRLLGQLTAWLQQRQAGVLHWRLGWQGRPAATALDFRHRRPTRDTRLLRSQLHDALARTRLDAAVDGLWLETVHVVPWSPASATLLPDRPADDALSWEALLERLSARLGPARVQTVQRAAHWDPARRQRWRAALQAPLDTEGRRGSDHAAAAPALALAAMTTLWEPPWWLPQPRRLDTGPDGHPRLKGQRLRRVLGPQRIATGWWDTPVAWEMGVATSADGRCWWLHRHAQPGPTSPGEWRLAGVYA